jgi:hypothetical protein
MSSAANFERARPAKGINVALWIVQVLLALFFLFAGFNHGLRPIDEAAKMAPWVASVPVALVRFIGFAELAGALGLVFPAATRVAPRLTPLAALGLALVMGLAIPFHILRGEAKVIGMHIIVVGLALFVAWGRARRAPIASRAVR